MTSSRDDPALARLHELIELQCEGALAPEEADELSRLVQSDPQRLRLYVQYMHLQAGLYARFGAAAEGQFGDPLASPADGGDAQLARPQSAGQRLSGDEIHPTPAEASGLPSRPRTAWNPVEHSLWGTWLDAAPALLAAVLLLAFGVLIGARGTWAVRRAEPTAAAAVDAPAPTATLAAVAGSMADGTRQWTAGDLLAAGDRIQLAAGTAEVVFHDGATLQLAGPCELLLEAPGRAFLHHGELVASIGGTPSGLVIDTPLLSVTDLGTRFAVSVERSGSSRVYVLQGRVRLDSRLAEGTRLAPLELSAGAAARLARTGQPAWQAVAFDAARFGDLQERLTHLHNDDRPTAAVPGTEAPPTQAAPPAAPGNVPLGPPPRRDALLAAAVSPLDDPVQAVMDWRLGRFGADEELAWELRGGRLEMPAGTLIESRRTFDPSKAGTLQLSGTVELLVPDAWFAVATRAQTRSLSENGVPRGLAALVALRTVDDADDPRPMVAILDGYNSERHVEQACNFKVGDRLQFELRDSGGRVEFRVADARDPRQALALALATDSSVAEPHVVLLAHDPLHPSPAVVRLESLRLEVAADSPLARQLLSGGPEEPAAADAPSDRPLK